MYDMWYVVLTVVFLAGAVAYWVVTRPFTREEGIYLPESEDQKEA